ncbi:COP1-interactive protein 1-like [Impatiens glandulifera]|uniref:COP1-interactive protein 1-like n=1 Tax=Impatiens glandulifera TaxID=253017 RepID=UPI001FB16331|nr:COP1-interactive protein 1-like [Impatiens glandulifera]
MTKSRWRESLRSFGRQVDHDNSDQLKNTKLGIQHFPSKPPQLLDHWRHWNSSLTRTMQYKALQSALFPERGLSWCKQPDGANHASLVPRNEIDNKVSDIMKLIKTKKGETEDKNSNKESKLIQLVEDIHKQYHLLHSLYDNLAGELIEKARIAEQETSISNYSSDSDSYYSTDNMSGKNSPRIEITTPKTKEEFKTPSSELAELRNRLSIVTDEKEAIGHDYSSSQTKLQELEKMIKEMEERNSGLQNHITEHENTHSSLLNRIEETDGISRSKMELLTAHSNDLQLELDNIRSQKSQLEEKNNEASSRVKNIMDQVSFLQQEVHSLNSQKIESNEKLETTSALNSNLETELNNLKSETYNHEHVIETLREENKQLKQSWDKKIDEASSELRKNLEDQIRFLSRRIKVAEQLHVENSEVYRTARDKYLDSDSMKLVAWTASEMMNELNTAAMKFEEYSEHLLNRISSTSCAVVFAKEWTRRKRKEAKEVEAEIQGLIRELHLREEEVLGYREKVWKVENKVRKLEKVVKEKEEGMMALGEEKREAIRQLCVWIDYHRSSRDYFKRVLSNKGCNSS